MLAMMKRLSRRRRHQMIEKVKGPLQKQRRRKKNVSTIKMTHLQYHLRRHLRLCRQEQGSRKSPKTKYLLAPSEVKAKDVGDDESSQSSSSSSDDVKSEGPVAKAKKKKEERVHYKDDASSVSSASSSSSMPAGARKQKKSQDKVPFGSIGGESKRWWR